MCNAHSFKSWLSEKIGERIGYFCSCALVDLEESRKFIASVSDDNLTKLYQEFVTLLETHFLKPLRNSFDSSKLNRKKK